MEKQYKIVGHEPDYQIVEQFGDYRISKKHFKTARAAKKHIETRLHGVAVNYKHVTL